MYFPRPVGQLASDTLCRFTKSSLTQIQPDSHSCMHARSTRIDSGWLAAKFSARLPPAACVLESDRSKAVSDSYKIYFSHSSQFCDHRYSRTGGGALQLSGATEGKGGGIEGADARQSASRSTAPRRTHAQTTSSCWNTLAPAGEASRAPYASVYRSNC